MTKVASRTAAAKIVSWTVVFLWMALIFFLSRQPGTESGELSRGITAFIIDIARKVAPQFDLETSNFHFFIRKNAHFFAYFILGVFVMNAMRTSRIVGFRRFAWTIVICVLYAISDETHQLFIPGRSGEVRDVLIDTAGAATGIGFYLLISWFFSKRSRYSKKVHEADSIHARQRF
ncbi:hypothetical protein BEP19_13045 [Ammoniphilus oxalaticus]|uniref:VanZ-like domain-containing protein n=1 Tax=Ammoniphilus oxalaticus TaxID=66863 RepID=A0A419SH79_9BACL|nr:VanZ family protein [Ammoniphilus oxalaticus]RKD23138.1 hypothetical protein BEP19_13045 [Ammoniphilus oxalaticus]